MSHPFPPFTRAHWPEEDSEIIHRERRGDGEPGLSAGLDGALFGHVAGLAAVVAVDLAGLAALYGDVSDLSAPERSRSTGQPRIIGI